MGSEMCIRDRSSGDSGSSPIKEEGEGVAGEAMSSVLGAQDLESYGLRHDHCVAPDTAMTLPPLPLWRRVTRREWMCRTRLRAPITSCVIPSFRKLTVRRPG